MVVRKFMEWRSATPFFKINVLYSKYSLNFTMMARNREPIFKHYPVISLRVVFFEAFACASIAVAACIKICARANLAVSAAKSASSTCPFALSKLAFMFCKFEIELSKRLEIAPIFPRRVDIIDIAASIVEI